MVIWALQLLIIQNGMETVRKFQDWAGPAVWVMMLILAIYLCVKSGTFRFTSDIPMDVLLEKTKDAGVPGTPGSWTALLAVAAIWVTYFAALYLNFCDFSRYAPDKASLRKGNIWGLPVNLILFSLVAGVTTIAAFDVYGEVLLHPDQISAKFDSWFLAAACGADLRRGHARHQRRGELRLAGFRLLQCLSQADRLQEGRLYRRRIALVLYPFAPWEGSAAAFVNIIGATMGPIFGIMMVDYYLIRKGEVDVEALYREDGEFRFQSGWHVNAFIAAGIGAIFSSILPNFTNWLPSWWGVYGWFFGVAIGGAIYYVLRTMALGAGAQDGEGLTETDGVGAITDRPILFCRPSQPTLRTVFQLREVPMPRRLWFIAASSRELGLSREKTTQISPPTDGTFSSSAT